MNKLLSEKFQLILLVSLLVLSLIVTVAYLFICNDCLVNSWFINCFNFVGKLNPSGALVFAGIAAGLTYTTHRLLFYRNIVFMFGFVFAICQALISALVPVYALDPMIMFLVYMALTSGVGFIFFSFIAIAAFEYDRRNDEENDSKAGDKENNSNNINLNPSMKSDSAQPSPAPSDLAHDLRYSRSRARRSPGRR